MADTVYVDNVTPITADTMNDLNRLHYTYFGDPASVTAAKQALLLDKHGADIASATGGGTLDLDSATGDLIDLTGTTTKTAITLAEGLEKTVRCTGAMLWTNGASLVLPGGQNITTTAGDVLVFRGYAAGVVRCVSYEPIGQHPLNTLITNSLGADVDLNNTANYFDGPTVAQGTVGTWYATGTVTCKDTAGAAAFLAKLWDGTTVIDSGQSNSAGVNGVVSISLSGKIASPAANIRISVRDSTSTSGKILFQETGNTKDSTVTAMRVA